MYDMVALGELLIDFIQNGSSAAGNPVFEANPGGAPCKINHGNFPSGTVKTAAP